MNRSRRRLILAAALSAAWPNATTAASLTVYGGQTYSAALGGRQGIYVSGGAVNDSGIVVGNEQIVGPEPGLALGGSVTTRWDSSGSPAVELPPLYPLLPLATPYSYSVALNNAGAIAGVVGSVSPVGATYAPGFSAVRWEPGAAAPTKLNTLGLSYDGLENNFVLDINQAGTIVGSSDRTHPQTQVITTHAVRWDAGGIAVTELDSLSRHPTGLEFSYAQAINDGGEVVGTSSKYVGSQSRGLRPVRWSAGGTAVTELQLPWPAPNVEIFAIATALNNAGLTVGTADRYLAGANLGPRPLRWQPGATLAEELEVLGTSAVGESYATVVDVNEAGDAIGYVDKHDAAGTFLGQRAVRWNRHTTAAAELQSLSIASEIVTNTYADAINDAGFVVGSSQWESGAAAVFWRPEGTVVDLNSLIDPASGWMLNYASAISNAGWVAGVGAFDPDGHGGEAPYPRLFLMHVPATAIPEPHALMLAVLAVTCGIASRTQDRAR